MEGRRRFQFGLINALLWTSAGALLLAFVRNPDRHWFAIMATMILIWSLTRQVHANNRAPTRAENRRMIVRLLGVLVFAIVFTVIAIGLVIIFSKP